MEYHGDISNLWIGRLETAFDKAKINLDVIDSKFNIRYMDLSWRRKHGDPAGKKCYEYFADRHEVCPKCRVIKALRARKVVITEDVIKKEHNRPVEVITVPFKSEGEWFAAEISIDISERKRAAQALKDSEERYRLLTEISPDIIFIVNKTGRLEYINKAAVKTYGGNVKNYRSKTIKELFPAKTANRQLKHIKETIESNRSLYVEAQTPFRGKTLWLETWLIPLKHAGKPVNSVLGVSRNVTDRKLAEVSLKRSDEVLRRDKKSLERLIKDRSGELMTAQQELDQSKRLADIGALAATVAHELRNPLAAIRIANYNIRQKRTDPSIDKNIVNIEKKILEANQIINNLLFYSHIKTPHFEKVNVCHLLKECIEDSAGRFADYAVSVSGRCSKDIFIKADPSHMKEVFTNILNNAYEAFPKKKGKIRITARPEKNSYASISFTDDGIGVNKADLKKAFDPFFTRKAKGIGLGLSLCHKLVSVHGGKISIVSKPGKGTTITILLPTI